MCQGPEVGGSCPTCGTERKPERGWGVVGEVEVGGEVGGVFSTRLELPSGSFRF